MLVGPARRSGPRANRDNLSAKRYGLASEPLQIYDEGCRDATAHMFGFWDWVGCRAPPVDFHLDNEAAKDTLFSGLAASGWHTAAITMRLLVEGGMPLAGGIVGAGGELDWPNPTRPGDSLQVEREVLDIRPSRSRPHCAKHDAQSEARGSAAPDP